MHPKQQQQKQYLRQQRSLLCRAFASSVQLPPANECSGNAKRPHPGKMPKSGFLYLAGPVS